MFAIDRPFYKLLSTIQVILFTSILFYLSLLTVIGVGACTISIFSMLQTENIVSGEALIKVWNGFKANIVKGMLLSILPLLIVWNAIWLLATSMDGLAQKVSVLAFLGLMISYCVTIFYTQSITKSPVIKTWRDSLLLTIANFPIMISLSLLVIIIGLIAEYVSIFLLVMTLPGVIFVVYGKILPKTLKGLEVL